MSKVFALIPWTGESLPGVVRVRLTAKEKSSAWPGMLSRVGPVFSRCQLRSIGKEHEHTLSRPATSVPL